MRTALRMLLPFRLRQWGRRWLRLPTAEPDGAARAAILKAAVRHALQITHHYFDHLSRWIPGAPRALRGMHVLELGPGRDFTPALILAGHGADVTLVDLYLERWDPYYHPAFYRAARQEIRRTYPDWPLRALDEVIARGDHWGGPLRTRGCSLERLTGIPDRSIDLTLSNAVFEHLYDVPQALRELHRVTRPGGIGSHQVDFRDHRDFSRPLEFLCEADFARSSDKGSTDHGNTLRPHELTEMLQRVGFRIEAFYPNAFADAAYLADVRPRVLDRFRHLTDEQLRPISGRFVFLRISYTQRGEN